MTHSNQPSAPEDTDYRDAVAAHRDGRWDQAIAGYQHVLERDRGHLPTLNNLAALLMDLGRIDEATAYYQQGLNLHPQTAELHANYGNLLRQKGSLADAARHYELALAQSPGLSEVRYALGVLLRRLKRPKDARRELEQCAAERKSDPRSYVALAMLALDDNDPNEAFDIAGKAIACDPDDTEALNIFGVTHKELGRYSEARAAFDAALMRAPDHAEAHYNRGIIRLLKGELSHAWDDYEWRWQGAGRQMPGADLGKPVWRAQSLDGRRLIIVSEQGFGDTIQCIRYAPRLKEMGANVVLQCRPELAALMNDAPGVDAIITPDDPMPDFDYFVPILSLPDRFRAELGSIPASGRYLNPPRRDTLTKLPGDGLAIGLVWAGSSTHSNDANRSLELSALATVTDQANMRFYSLQMGAARDQLVNLDEPHRIADLTDQINDFGDTANILTGMDLVITVDTAVAHLAGALGRPAWVLLPHVPDWRWMLDRSDTPWYQSLKLFRQPTRGDWQTPLGAIKEALQKLASSHVNG